MKSCWYPAIMAAAIVLGSSAALAQLWPSKPIRAFIPFAAGSATDIAAEKFRVAAGFEAVHIAYKGGAEALADVVGGRIDFYYCPISTALPFIEDKRVLALAASTSTRAPELPDVPTSLDAGYPNSDLTIWYGVFMPSKAAGRTVEKCQTATA